jgi:thiamine biosynthesis lipoprotein
VEEVWSMVQEADRRYNRFLAGSVLAGVNRKAAGEAVEVDDELFLILQLCETFRKATGGFFDVTAGSRVPDRAVALDVSAHTVRFSRPGMRLDLGGFAKGFVLEKAVRAVVAQAESALLSFGGSSVAAVGRHPLGEPWPAAVAHTYYADRTAYAFSLENEALSVSGKDPRGRGHIVDPATGNTLEKEGLVAVTGPSPMVAEVLSTALWVAPAEKRGEILASFDGYRAWEILCRTDGQALTLSI